MSHPQPVTPGLSPRGPAPREVGSQGEGQPTQDQVPGPCLSQPHPWGSRTRTKDSKPVSQTERNTRQERGSCVCAAARMPGLWSQTKVGANTPSRRAEGKSEPARAVPLPTSAPPLHTPQRPLCTHQTLHPNSFRSLCCEMETLQDIYSFIHC